MAYSVDCKNEVANSPLGPPKVLVAELAAFLRTKATISIGFRDEIKIRFESEFSSTARRIFKIIKLLYNYEAQIQASKNSQLRKASLYRVKIDDEEIARYILEDAGFQAKDFELKDKKIGNLTQVYTESQKRAYLKGAFLGGGSIIDPNRGYHLEIILNNQENLDTLLNISKEFGIQALARRRKDKYIYYIKNSETISDFLSVVGASSAMLELENVKVLREVKNEVQRVVNCETANISKVVNAAVRQIEAIEKIQKTKGLDILPLGLKEMAELRMDYPDDSLKDLGERMNPPLGKSGVNHRMKKIIQISEDL